MISQSIASEVIPEQRFAFRSDIDLVDETLREGAERASVPTSLDAKCRLAKAIAETGVRSLVVGMFPDVPHNIDLLDALLHQQTIGQIPPDTRFIIISHVGETMRQTLRVLDGLEGHWSWYGSLPSTVFRIFRSHICFRLSCRKIPRWPGIRQSGTPSILPNVAVDLLLGLRLSCPVFEVTQVVAL